MTSSVSRPTDAAEVMDLVGKAFRQTRQPIEQLVRDYGITAAQYGILYQIAANPGISRAEVARQNFISPQAAQVALATLESKGLVARQSRSDSQRIVGAALTEEGERVFRACDARTAALAEDFVAPLRVVERHMLIDLLRRCIEQMAEPSA